MQATIIYNDKAGGIEQVPAEQLVAALRGQGYDPVIEITKDKAELTSVLDGVQGLVLSVGGDGTLRATALHLLGRKDVELAFIPAGTANNIAHAFGVQDQDWKDIVASLPSTRHVPFDVGKITGPLGEHYFLEAFGAGIYADSLASYDPDEGKSVLRAIGTLLDVMPNYEAQEWRITLDGQDVSGKYVLLEVLNTPMTGPHLNLAPDADPSDGLLDVVLIAESEREGLLTYARKMRAGELEDLSSVTVTRAKRIELVWTGFPLHIDAESKVEIEDPAEIEQAKRVTPELRDERKDVVAIEVVPAALMLRLPALVAEEQK